VHGHDPANLWFALTRAGHYLACLVLMSVFAFDRVVVGRVLHGAGGALSGWHDVFGRIVKWALPVALLTGGWWFALATVAMSGLPVREALAADTLSVVWNHTHFGWVWKIRLAAWAGTAIVDIALVKVRDLAWPRGLLMWLGLVSSGVLCVSLVWAGHAEGDGAWQLWGDVVHIGVCGVWPGGLAPLVGVVWGTAEASPGLERLVKWFSNWSLTAVVIVSVTGVINAYYLLGGPGNLFATGYGRVLLVKLVLFGVILGLGAMNRVYLRRGITTGRNLAKLRMNVAVEIALAVGVVVAVGYLGLMPPAGHG